MGCVSLKKKMLSQMEPLKTVNGLLKVTIEEACIQKPPSKLFSMDPYLKIRMSNQQYRGFVHKKAGRLDLFNESFQFIINSCYKSEGRSVSIEVWDKHIMGDKLIGMGTVDIQPIITFDQKNMLGSQVLKLKQSNQSHQNNEAERDEIQQKSKACRCKRKVFLSNGINKVGYVNTMFEFIEQPIVVVGFKFIYANLRRRSSMLTSMHVRIQVMAGEEVLSTRKQKDKDTKSPPSWEDELLLFNIPKSLKQCIIRVLDDQDEVGRLKLQLTDILSRKGEHRFTEQLQTDQTVSGVIKFTALVGLSSIVQDSKKMLKRKQSDQRERSKQESPHSIHKKFQFPQQKQKKLYDSQEKTNFQTQPNQQQSSRYNNGKPQASIYFMNSQDLRQ